MAYINIKQKAVQNHNSNLIISPIVAKLILNDYTIKWI